MGRFVFFQRPGKCRVENIHIGNSMMTVISSQKERKESVFFFFLIMKYLAEGPDELRDKQGTEILNLSRTLRPMKIIQINP